MTTRSHGRSPWREAFELLATKPARSGSESIVLGQSAAGRAYVKDLTVVRGEQEGWGPFLIRAGKMLEMAIRHLPVEAPVSPQEPARPLLDASGLVDEIPSPRRRRARQEAL